MVRKNNQVQKFRNLYREKRIHITAMSCLGSFAMGSAKLAAGVLSASPLTCANGFYSYGMTAAKGCIAVGMKKADTAKSQYQCYSLSGIILFMAAIAYMVYSVKWIYFPTYTTYSPVAGITIARFTFMEIGMNIRGIFTGIKENNLLLKGLKLINLSSSCICLVLTQTALLSFATDSQVFIANYKVNGYMGIAMAVLSEAIAVFMILQGRKHIKKGEKQ